MKSYLQQWLRNLWVNALIGAGVFIFLLVFSLIFYPEALQAFALMGQAGMALANGLKLWPIIVLSIIVSAMPRRRYWSRDRNS